MSEKIYTIPVNEAFDECAADHSLGCPFCRLRAKLEANEIELALGASMMEPDVRQNMNEKGFCGEHFDKLLSAKNRLGLSLILESHMNQLREEVNDKFLTNLVGKHGTTALKRLGKLNSTCYICDRVNFTFERMVSNAALLWAEDEDFRKKIPNEPYFCLPHLAMWLEAAQGEVKKNYSDFYKSVTEPTYKYFDELRADVSWFCKKFDYRYDNEPWGNSRDSADRARKFLRGDKEYREPSPAPVTDGEENK